MRTKKNKDSLETPAEILQGDQKTSVHVFFSNHQDPVPVGSGQVRKGTKIWK